MQEIKISQNLASLYASKHMSVSSYIALGGCIGTAIAYQAYQAKVVELEALSFELRGQIGVLNGLLEHKNKELDSLSEETSALKLTQDASHRDVIKKLQAESVSLMREKEALFSKLALVTSSKEELQKTEKELRETVSRLEKVQNVSKKEVQDIKDAYKFKLNNEVERLNASQGMKVTELTKEVKQLKEQAASKDALYSQLVEKSATQILNYEKESASLKREASIATKELANLLQTSDEFRVLSVEEKSVFKSTIEELREEVQTLKKELTDAHTELETTKKKHAESETALKEQELKNGALLKENMNLETSNEELKLDSKTHERTISDLKKFTKNLQTEIVEATRAKEGDAELKGQVEELKSSKKALEGEHKDLEKAKMTLEDEMKEQAAVIKKLEVENSEFCTKEAKLREELASFEALKASNKALVNGNEALVKNNEAILTENESTKAKNEILSKKVEEMKSKVSEIKAEFRAFKDATETEDRALGKDEEISKLTSSLSAQREKTSLAEQALNESAEKIEQLEKSALAAKEEFKKSLWAVEVNLKAVGALLQGFENLQKYPGDFRIATDFLRENPARSDERPPRLTEEREADGNNEENNSASIQQELASFRKQLVEIEAKKEQEITEAVNNRVKESSRSLQKEIDDLNAKHKAQATLMTKTLDRLKEEIARRKDLEEKLSEANGGDSGMDDD